MQPVSTTPDEYIASLPDPVRAEMTALDTRISQAMAGHRRCLWEGVFWGGSEQHIIGYGECSYVRSDKTRVEWFMVGLARQKNYLSVYVNAVEGRRYLLDTFAGKLGKVKLGRTSIGFRTLADLDLDTLTELVTRAAATTSNQR